MTARSAEVGRMRLAVGLTMVGAVLLMSGVLMTLVGEVTRLSSARKWDVAIGNGEIMAAAGLACGLAAMVAVVAGAVGRRPAGLRVRQVGTVRQVGSVRQVGTVNDLDQVPDQGPALVLAQAGAGDSDGQRERASQGERASQRQGHEVAVQEWLSQFRPAQAAYVPEPESWPTQQPESWPTQQPESWPRQQPESWPRQQESRVGGSDLGPSELSDSRAADDRAADDTVPLPVIAPAIPPAPVSPAYDSLPLVPSAYASPLLSHLAPPDPVPAAARAKLDQIKDLYVTAEAIGEDALGKHFDELSERQRQLIREYFHQAGVGPDSVPGTMSDRARNSAALPG